MRVAAASAPVSSARVAREVRAHAMSERLRRALDEHDASRAAVALSLGVTRSRVDDYCDPDHEAGLRAADIAALPHEVARDLLRMIAGELGCAVVSLPEAARMSGAKAAARFVREGGEGAAVTIEALADDGVMSPAEGAKVEKEMGDVIEAAVTLRESRVRRRIGGRG